MIMLATPSFGFSQELNEDVDIGVIFREAHVSSDGSPKYLADYFLANQK